MFSYKPLFILTAIAWNVLAAPASSDVVDLGYARYKGIRNDTLDIVTYFGLAYAEPPTGPHRWRHPVPIDNSTFYKGNPLLDATVVGNRCYQGAPAWIGQLSGLPADLVPAFPDYQTESEDCLHLDVITPIHPKYPTLPVVVYFHGGGYAQGSSIATDGSYFVSHAFGSVIWVSVQYRLGVYGFLGGYHINEEGTANAGLLDQRLALEWVQKNIASFGGDPNRVTIWGGSAGGGSVTAQMMLYGGDVEPPFRAAVAEYPWWQPFHDNAHLDNQYRDLLFAGNCSNVDCLRDLSESDLAKASQDVYAVGRVKKRYGFGDYYFGPSVDGTIIPSLPQEAFEAGKFSKVPLLTNHEAYEGWFLSNFSISDEWQIRADLEQVWPAADQEFFHQLFRVYPERDFDRSYFSDPVQNTIYAWAVPNTIMNSAFYRRQAIFGDAMISCPSRFIADALSKTGQPVWKLRFEAGTELHGSTAAYIFTHSDTTPNPEIANQLKSYMLSFVTSFDPNPVTLVGKPFWPFYISGMDSRVLVIKQDSITTAVDLDAGARCKFFKAKSHIVRN